MSESAQTRKLAAILAADVTGYSRLMAQDDAATVRALNESREIFREKIEAHGGHVIDMAGDSVLAEFASALEAVQCATEVQSALARKNAPLPEERWMRFRIGVNVGDILQQSDGTIYGDGVNIAARLESIGDPGGVTISGTVYDQVKSRLQVGFEFTGEQSVKNIPEPVRAYRITGNRASIAPASILISARPTSHRPWRRVWMVGAVIVLAVVVALGGWQAARVRKAALPKAEPVVAVLAFANMSGDAKQEYFSDGLTENIIDSLAQVRDLKVIARNSSFRYKGQAVDVRKVGEELGAKYLVEGSVRRSADTVRVTAQLVETGNGSHLWSKTYDRALTAKNVFAIQDEIAAAITSTLAGFYGVLRQEDLALAKRKPPRDLNSYDCVLLGMGYFRAFSLKTFRAARDCAEKAVTVDPDFAPLWAVLATVYRGEVQFGYDPRPGSLDRSVDAAQRAIRIDPNQSDYHAELAITFFFRGELEAFRTEADRVIELSPKGTSMFGYLGIYFWYAGEYEKGLALTEKAKVLDPYFPGWYHQLAFHDHYRNGRFGAALAEAHKQNMPDYVHGLSLIVAAYGQLGRAAEAQPSIKRIREIEPGFNAREHWRYRFQFQPEYLERLLDGMRKAGMKIPEHRS